MVLDGDFAPKFRWSASMASLTRVMQSFLALAILAMMLVCSALSAQTPATDLRGIYLGGNDITHGEPTSLGAEALSKPTPSPESPMPENLA